MFITNIYKWGHGQTPRTLVGVPTRITMAIMAATGSSPTSAAADGHRRSHDRAIPNRSSLVTWIDKAYKHL